MAAMNRLKIIQMYGLCQCVCLGGSKFDLCTDACLMDMTDHVYGCAYGDAYQCHLSNAVNWQYRLTKVQETIWRLNFGI
jgi:hypothetical protein